MAGTEIMLKLEQRTKLGKGIKGLRREGFIPAVIHDHGKESIHAQAQLVELLKVYRQAGKNHPLELKVGDRTFLALIKDANFRPPKQILQHVVFQAIKRDEKVEAEIPIIMVGTPPAELTGLIVLTQLDSIKVESLPQDLPEQFEVAAEKLVELGDKIMVSDLEVPQGVTILTELEHPIATVHETKANMADEAATEEETEDTDETASEDGEAAATTEEE